MNLLELTQLRHSVRNYSNQKVEDEKLHYIMECVRMAPSAVNFQPWKFILVRQPEDLKLLHTCYNREWFMQAPLCFIACKNHEEEWIRKSDGKAHGDIDVAIAVEHLCLAAAEQGLGTCWVCNFDVERCTQLFGLPANLEPIALIPIGYNANPAPSEKKRKEMEQIFEER